MKKYKVFRSFGLIDKDIKKHELIAVVSGKSIDAAEDELMRVVREDALGIEKYEKGYTAGAYAPEEVGSDRRVKRYDYCLNAILSPDYGGLNDIIEYGIMEEDE